MNFCSSEPQNLSRTTASVWNGTYRTQNRTNAGKNAINWIKIPT